VLKDGTSLWWRAMGRNKKCITLNLRAPRGRELARALALGSNVLIENFRPGTMEKWGLGPDELRAEAPDLVYTRVSGYGQTGPYAARPGFASVCEGIGGLRYINGFPGEPPVRPNLSLGDTLAALHAVIGVLRAEGMLDRTDLQSFDWRVLHAARRPAPDLSTICLTAEQRRPPEQLAPHKEIAGHRHRPVEGQILINGADPGLGGVAGRAKGDRPALDINPARGRAMHAGENLDESGFPGSVISEKRVHLAGIDVHRHVVQRGKGAEALDDLLKPDKGRSGRRHVITLRLSACECSRCRTPQ